MVVSLHPFNTPFYLADISKMSLSGSKLPQPELDPVYILPQQLQSAGWQVDEQICVEGITECSWHSGQE